MGPSWREFLGPPRTPKSSSVSLVSRWCGLPAITDDRAFRNPSNANPNKLAYLEVSFKHPTVRTYSPRWVSSRDSATTLLHRETTIMTRINMAKADITLAYQGNGIDSLDRGFMILGSGIYGQLGKWWFLGGWVLGRWFWVGLVQGWYGDV